MTLPITTTRGAGTSHLNILVHGPAGAGKTTLCATTGDLEHTLIISAEGGLLPLRDLDVPMVDVVAYTTTLRQSNKAASVLDAMRAVFAMLRKGDHGYTWVCLDSVSEIAEVVLTHELAQNTHAMKAYGEMATKMANMLRLFRDLPLNVVMSCKQGREAAEDGTVARGPMLPGKKLSQSIGYMFDEVFALVTSTDDKGEIRRGLLTQHNGVYEAKDRSGSLAQWEPPNLADIASKIRG